MKTLLLVSSLLARAAGAAPDLATFQQGDPPLRTNRINQP
jgi:hypothetical protein